MHQKELRATVWTQLFKHQKWIHRSCTREVNHQTERVFSLYGWGGGTSQQRAGSSPINNISKVLNDFMCFMLWEPVSECAKPKFRSPYSSGVTVTVCHRYLKALSRVDLPSEEGVVPPSFQNPTWGHVLFLVHHPVKYTMSKNNKETSHTSIISTHFLSFCLNKQCQLISLVLYVIRVKLQQEACQQLTFLPEKTHSLTLPPRKKSGQTFSVLITRYK